MSSPKKVAVVLLEFEPSWLALARERRREHADAIGRIVARHPEVSVRWFDADALGRGYTDFVVCEFDDLASYHFLWEELRDHEVFSHPYVRLKDVHLGLERAYEAYEARGG